MFYSLAIPRTVALQAPLSMGFPKQEYWSGFPFLSPRDLPNSGIEPVSTAMAGRIFTTEQPGQPDSVNMLPFMAKTEFPRQC